MPRAKTGERHWAFRKRQDEGHVDRLGQLAQARDDRAAEGGRGPGPQPLRGDQVAQRPAVGVHGDPPALVPEPDEQNLVLRIRI
jgi:hypothetical protein